LSSSGGARLSRAILPHSETSGFDVHVACPNQPILTTTASPPPTPTMTFS
jgi:hypothetical protein